MEHKKTNDKKIDRGVDRKVKCEKSGHKHHRGIWQKLKHSPIALGIIALAWFIFRVGSRPTRVIYPCQQATLTQMLLSLKFAVLPFLATQYRRFMLVLKNDYVRIFKISAVISVILLFYFIYATYNDAQARIRWSRTIPKAPDTMEVAGGSGTGAMTGLFTGALPAQDFPTEVSTSEAIVSFGYDPSVTYGTSPPFNQANNPAYDLVWDTVERLELGSSANPLDDLIDPGDTVLIKVNLVQDHEVDIINGLPALGPGRDQCTVVYTNPAVTRPLIDMAIQAGATTILLGDGGPGYTYTEDVIDSTKHGQMISSLQASNPGITIKRVNLNSRSSWHWINLGSDSSFAGSGYTDYDLGDTSAENLADTLYYKTSDPQGVNPGGEAMGWYAISDSLLDTDVIINVPKLKVHMMMVYTGAIKMHVGSTLASTYDNKGNSKRIAHTKTGFPVPADENVKEQITTSFDNDIFWRAILDMNKIILYADQNGNLQSTQQRKYLNVMDGIEAAESSSHCYEWDQSNAKIFDSYTILASVDPLAMDAVGSRLIGYDYTTIPSIANADSDTSHPIGTSNPEEVIVLGEEVDDRFDHIFLYHANWGEYTDSKGLDITDFTPPSIDSVGIEESGSDVTITAEISGGLVAYLRYRQGGNWYLQKMSKSGSTYSATIPRSGLEYYQVLAQDNYFNTKHGTLESYTPIDMTKLTIDHDSFTCADDTCQLQITNDFDEGLSMFFYTTNGRGLFKADIAEITVESGFDGTKSATITNVQPGTWDVAWSVYYPELEWPIDYSLPSEKQSITGEGAPVPTGNDEFTDTTLDMDRWTWRNLPNSYSLTAQSGWLQMITEKNTNTWYYPPTHRDSGHFLYQTISGDFTIETRTQGEPSFDHQESGLMIRQDSTHWANLKMGHQTTWAPDDGTDRYIKDVVTDGIESVHLNYDALADDNSEAYLRITRTGDSFVSYYSLDGSDWIEHASWTQVFEDPIMVGIYSQDGSSDTNYESYFDYFRITT